MDSSIRSASVLGGALNTPKPNKSRETISTQRDTISKIFEEGMILCINLNLFSSMSFCQCLDVFCSSASSDCWHSYTVGLSNIVGLLKSEDLDVQIHAVKMIANLAAEGMTNIQFLSALYSYASDQFYVYDPNWCFAFTDFS